MSFTHGCGRLSQGMNIRIVSQETLILGCNDLYKMDGQRQEPGLKRVSENETRAPGECLSEQNCLVLAKTTWVAHFTLHTVV